MKRFIVESKFTHQDATCVVLLLTAGHRCGYVSVSEDSPLFGLDYTDQIDHPELLEEIKKDSIGKRGLIPLLCWDGESLRLDFLFNVHGGLTYAADNSDYPIETKPSSWWFGFDCAHLNDAKDWEAVKAVFDPDLWVTSYELDQKYGNHGIIRTKEYVEQECRNLAEQIKYVETKLKESK